MDMANVESAALSALMTDMTDAGLAEILVAYSELILAIDGQRDQLLKSNHYQLAAYLQKKREEVVATSQEFEREARYRIDHIFVAIRSAENS